MEYAAALAIAQCTQAALAPYCARMAIAGSVRRQRPQVKDIEILALPLQEPADLFGETLVAHQGFCAVVNQWPKVKGEPTGKYTQGRLPEGIILDLFIADAENWGWQQALRTGSTAFTAVLVPALKRAGYTSLNGYLFHRGVLVPVREEAEVFACAGMPWVEPTAREVAGR